MAKIYTRGGDRGETALISGKRLKKDHLRFEAYGTLDELNSAIGLALSHCSDQQSQLRPQLERIQNQLFNYGCHLACDDPALQSQLPAVSEAQIEWLEKAIDKWQESLPALKEFVLPGGSSAAAALHLARTICRRAERLAVSLSHQEEPIDLTLRYLNRLSDALFVFARAANFCVGVDDVMWSKSPD